MMKIPAGLSIVAVAAALGACAIGPNNPASTQSVPVATQQMPYSAGAGVVQWVRPAPGSASTGASSARGAATPEPAGMQRLGIRLDNGRMVYVDTMSRDFAPGMRVELADNFEIRKL